MNVTSPANFPPKFSSRSDWPFGGGREENSTPFSGGRYALSPEKWSAVLWGTRQMWKAKVYRPASRGASLKADRFFRHRRALAEYGDGRRGDGEGAARHHVPADISQLVPFSACFPLSRGAALLQGRKDSANGRSGHLRRGGKCVRPCHPAFSLFWDFVPGKALFFHFSAKNLSNFSGSAFTFIRNFLIINKSLEMRKPSSKSKGQRERKSGDHSGKRKNA